MDFSGYIDIARGAAKILGFRLNRNFNSPYLSKSIKEFWARWHITLSQWLRDYIFLPLAYFLSNHMKKEKYAGITTEKYLYTIAISVTFLLCGLWHGVGWNYIAWGGLFAVYLVIGTLTEKPKKLFYRKTGFIAYKTAYNTMQIIITFLLVCFAWIFFRAADFGTSIQIISRLFSGWGDNSMVITIRSLQRIIGHQGLTVVESGFVLILIPCIEFIEYHFRGPASGKTFFSLARPVRWGAYYLLVLLICYFGRSETNTFIYFQF
jgi:alginate O-acetyltransferase complex protein AlgI